MNEPGNSLWRVPRACAAVLLVAGLALSGCRSASQSKVDQAPVVVNAEVTSSEFAGSALSGPLASTVDDAALAGAWRVTGHVLAVQTLPTDGFEPIGPLAKLIYGDAKGELMAPSSRLVYSTLIRRLDADAPASSQPTTLPAVGIAPAHLSDVAGGVAAGTTFKIQIIQPDGPADEAIRQAVHVEISRKAQEAGYEIAIISQDRVAVDAEVSSEPAALQTIRETVVIPREVGDGGDRFILAIPMAFKGSTAQGVVVELDIETTPDDAGALAGDLKKNIDEQSAKIRDLQQQKVGSPSDLLTNAALDALISAGDAPRGTLVYLANQTGASLAEAVALVADDQLLAVIAKSVREKVPNLATRDRNTVGWMLERSTISAVTSIADDETNTGLASVRGVLETYAGEAGRQLDLLQSLADGATSCDDLYNRLIAEHIIYLEDNSPASRVRAYDWLSARGIAPTGYDPLADTRARRDALDAYQEAITTEQK